MYQPLIKFHPYPAIITQVLPIFVTGSRVRRSRRARHLFPRPPRAARGMTVRESADQEGICMYCADIRLTG